jgi:hypothetical protein
MRAICLVVLLCFAVVLAVAEPPAPQKADTSGYVTPEIVDSLTSNTVSKPMAAVEVSSRVDPSAIAGAYPAAAAAAGGAPQYYGYYGYAPNYAHPYVGANPYLNSMHFAQAQSPAPAVTPYATYGFPYSAFPPIPPPMPTYLPPPPYIPIPAPGSAGALGAGAPGAPGAAPAGP